MHEMSPNDSSRDAAARALFDYCCLRDTPPRVADIIIGFGHFDPKIPRRCCELYESLAARLIVYTGGRGSGSADLATSEAEWFLQQSQIEYPHIPTETFLLETESTNTGENVRNTLRMLANRLPVQQSLDSLTTVLVANAYRQRRVWLTWGAQRPETPAVNAPPQTTFEQEAGLFASKGEELNTHLCGELDRLIAYAKRGYILGPFLPEPVRTAHETLRRAAAAPGTASPGTVAGKRQSR